MIDRKHFINLQGKQYVLFTGLLDHAHNLGLLSINTSVLQVPCEANKGLAIVQAIATFKGEEGPQTWSAHGDAGPASLKPNMVPASLRMAETRAIARVLRMATNVGETAFEELPGDLSEAKEERREYREPDARPSDPPRGGPPVTADEGTQRTCRDCGCDMTIGQVQMAIRNWGASYCLECRKKHPKLEEAA